MHQCIPRVFHVALPWMFSGRDDCRDDSYGRTGGEGDC